MAVLNYAPFADNARILSAAENSPSMKKGDPDRAAVQILQQALIDAGFPIPGGASGVFDQGTADAVVAAEVRFNLGRDNGAAGRQVIKALDEALAGRGPVRQGTTVVGANLSLMIQRTSNSMPVRLTHYLTTTMALCGQYGLNVLFQDRQNPPLDFASTYNVDFDVPTIRKASEKQTPGQPGTLRIIFANFDEGDPDWGVTEDSTRSGMPVHDFIVLNTAKIKVNGNTLLHEMIHCTGLSQHDDDATSVFAQGQGGLNFKPEHAARVGTAFYSDRIP